MPVDGNKRQVPKSIAGYGFKHLSREKIQFNVGLANLLITEHHQSLASELIPIITTDGSGVCSQSNFISRLKCGSTKRIQLLDQLVNFSSV